MGITKSAALCSINGHFIAINISWDKTSTENTLVISTHGFIKKRSKVPDNEILKAKHLRKKYFEDKDKQLKKKKK